MTGLIGYDVAGLLQSDEEISENSVWQADSDEPENGDDAPVRL